MVVERLRALSSCQLSDGLHRLGLRGIGLVGITPINDSWEFAGPALTVTFGDSSDGRLQRVEYLEHVEPGQVIVIQNHGRLDSSGWGGQRSIGARQKGATATVVHGACRDVPEALQADYPVFCLGRTVAGSRTGGRMPIAVNEPVTITGCRIEPGDLVRGDASGVIVVPQAHVEAVLAEAERLAAQEAAVRDAVATGEEFLASRNAVRAPNAATSGKALPR